MTITSLRRMHARPVTLAGRAVQCPLLVLNSMITPTHTHPHTLSHTRTHTHTPRVTSETPSTGGFAGDSHTLNFEVSLVLEYCELGSLRDALDGKAFIKGVYVCVCVCVVC